MCEEIKWVIGEINDVRQPNEVQGDKSPHRNDIRIEWKYYFISGGISNKQISVNTL